MASPNVRTRIEFKLGISSTISELKDLGSVDSNSYSDGFGEGGARAVKVAGSAIDYALGMGNITSASIVYIETDKELEVKINGTGNTPIPVKPLDSNNNGYFFTTGKAITSVHVTNTTSDIATLKVAIIGD